ncbi:MAG: GH116 family glycosyl hydrolase [Terrimicrobiaceae bacterium]
MSTLNAEQLAELTVAGAPRVYAGAELDTIAMPVGGICAGQLYFKGDGSLGKWDIMNQRAFGSDSLVRPSELLLQGFAARLRDRAGQLTSFPLNLKTFPATTFTAAYPAGVVSYGGAKDLPLSITLEGIAPFVPLDAEASGIPAAFLRVTLKNTDTQAVEGDVLGWLQNGVSLQSGLRAEDGARTATVRTLSGALAVEFAAAASPAGQVGDQVGLPDTKLPPLEDRPDFGTMALVLLAPAADARAQPSVEGDLAAGAAPIAASSSRPFDQVQVGAITAPFRLQAGETRHFTFAIAWHFPNFELSEWGKLQGKGRWYASRFASASAVVDKLAADGPAIVAATDLWREAYYDSTLPRWLLDRSIANLSTLATATCHRFADGRFYGFEGVYSFPGTCNHVWHYDEGMGRLFPELEKSLRTQSDFVPAVGLKSDGSIAMRIDGLPGSPDPLPERPILFDAGYNHWASIDGQCGLLLRTYRTHLLGTDDTFVKQYWPQIRLATGWLLARDSDGDGLPDEITHHTLDEDIAGPGPWISSLNLAALTAAAKMACIAGDTAFADQCEERIATGRKNFLAKLWNGDRFIHHSPESEKWRPGSYDGSHIDQVLGQQWAWRTGLGRILPEQETRAALASVFRNNFMADLGEYYAQPENQPSRVFAKAGTAGTVMATWPAGSYRPDGTKPEHLWDSDNKFHQGFYNETMSGFEHAFASHLIYEGMVAEGLTVARAVHDRHQPSSPMRGNPFNEPEAGEHYARAMASYATFLACGGFEYDGPAGVIGFAPRLQANDFKTAFTAAEGWGTFRQQQTWTKLEASLSVKRGTVKLTTVKLALPKPAHGVRQVTVTDAGKPLAARHDVMVGTISITLAEPVVLTVANNLTLIIQQ